MTKLLEITALHPTLYFLESMQEVRKTRAQGLHAPRNLRRNLTRLIRKRKNKKKNAEAHSQRELAHLLDEFLLVTKEKGSWTGQWENSAEGGEQRNFHFSIASLSPLHAT
jgi:hypothetical protein